MTTFTTNCDGQYRSDAFKVRHKIDVSATRMKKNHCPAAVKLPLVFSLVFGGVTAIICVCNLIFPPGGRQGYPDFEGFLMLLVEWPVMTVCRTLGAPANWLVNNTTGQFAVAPACVAVLVNSVLGMLFGMLVGKLIMQRRRGL